jgi:signal transduction histidine kinase
MATVTGTYRRGPEGSLRALVLCLRQARPSARPDDAMTGIEIVSTVSHELRSPLTSIKGYGRLLLNHWDRLSEEERRLMLEQVNHDADRVTRLITDLLDVSRLQAGRLILRRQLIDMPRLATSVIDKVRLHYLDLDAQIIFAADFPKVYADSDKVEQILTNLVENACKYGSARGLLIEGAVYPTHVSVAVTDQGEGIAAAVLPRLFSGPFRGGTDRATGSGLGLAISRGLVECHGGELVAESKPGKGATFRFTLPLVDLDKLQDT